MELQRFELKQEHLDLLRNCYIEWQDCEFGAPEIDPKRPYGNSSVISDILEILGVDVKTCPHCEKDLEEVDKDKYKKLHKETQYALQIITRLQTFELGWYRQTGRSIMDWVKEQEGD